MGGAVASRRREVDESKKVQSCVPLVLQVGFKGVAIWTVCHKTQMGDLLEPREDLWRSARATVGVSFSPGLLS